MSTSGAPRGRRPGSPDTRAAILDAARAAFASQGRAGASVRGIAAAAGVDAALVHHYFGTKDDLFLAALHLPLDPREVLAPVAQGGIDGAGERLVRTFLGVWDEEQHRLPLLALVRGVLEPGGERLVADGLLGLVLGPVGASLGIDEPERRMTLVASQLIGLVMARYVLRLEPLASSPAADLVPTYAPVIQGYLDGPLPRL